jgi:membrane associated rhomboid family serine protease
MARVYRVSHRKKKSVFGGLSVTLTLILINVIAFILFAILISSNIAVLDYIALKPANILQGKYLWTFITSMFMHGGLFHIFANMFSLLFIGSLVEKILGAKRYLYFYLISGLLAGLFFVFSSLIFTADFNTFAVGASGALFGLVGLLMLLTPNLPVFIMFIPIPIKMKYAAPGILIVLWLISIAGDVPIGNTAHLGGLVTGLIYGLYLKNKFKRKTKYINKYFSR